jgi:ABC-type Zn uptake system ZnuABC Zn-binding protein ZnuA
MIPILASVYPLADIARQVGGDYVKVDWFCESGQALPTEDLPDDARARLLAADLVLTSGEPWTIDGFDDLLRSQRIIRLDALDTAAAVHSPNALRWLDPGIARDVATQLCSRLSARRPRLEPYFRARTERFIAGLNDLDRHYRTVLASDPPRKVLAISSDWSRLLARYGIEPVIPVESTAANLGDAQLRQIVAAAREHRLTAVLLPADTPRGLLNDIQDRTDLTVVTLDALGSSAGGGRNSYLEILRYDLDQLNQAASRP